MGSHHHSHGHGNHGHHHGHHHDLTTRADNVRRITMTLVLVVAFMFAEVVGGLLTGSLALLADAGHMLSDAAALGLSLFAFWMAKKPASSRHTYGYYRTEILAALFNGATLVAIAAFILYEAYRRILEPPIVQGGLMMAIAAGGLLVNLVGLGLLSAGRNDNLNMRGAWLHVLGDALGSVGAIVAGALMWAFGWYWADPLASAIIALLIVYSAASLLRASVDVLMEGAPGHVDVDALRAALLELEFVREVHDLHVWTITSGLVAMSGHVIVAPHHFEPASLSAIRRLVCERFRIDHVTIQLEPEGFEEAGVPCDAPLLHP